MANIASRRAALLVLASLLPPFACSSSDDSTDSMLAQLEKMRNQVDDSQGAGDTRSDRNARSTDVLDPREDFQNDQAAASQANAGQGAQDWRDSTWDKDPAPTVAPTSVTDFLSNTDPKNRAIVTGVVAGAAVSAVAGGVAIAIEETKIHERIKKGLPVKPIFPWLKQNPGSPHSPKAKAKAVATEAPTQPPVTTTLSTTPIPTTTAEPALGEEIPLPVWIALGVLVCCCCAALVAAVIDCVFNPTRGKSKRSAKVAQKEYETSRSDSVSSYDSYDDSYYSDNSPSYAMVAPQDQYYNYSTGSVGYTYEYAQPSGLYESPVMQVQTGYNSYDPGAYPVTVTPLGY